MENGYATVQVKRLVRLIGRCVGVLFWGMSLISHATEIGCSTDPLIPVPAGPKIIVKTEAGLQRAVRSGMPGQVIVLEPGVYRLTKTLVVRTDNLTLRGGGSTCSEVTLEGPGMNNREYGDAPHGIWSDALVLRVQNLTIRDFYQHGILLNPGAESPVFEHIRVLDTGMQQLKSNPAAFGDGVDNGLVAHSVFGYTDGPPMVDHGGGTGYTNGVDVHAGKGWEIRDSHFEGFHTPDSADHLWAPAVLLWNGARDTVVKSNRFSNVDRAIAFGLSGRADDHHGGVIRDNHIEYLQGLYSVARRARSDAAIIVWSSPGTVVKGNDIFTRGNLRYSIEFRFGTEGAEAIGNRIDAPIGYRDGAEYQSENNVRMGD